MVTRWPAGAWYCPDHDGAHPAGPCPVVARRPFRSRLADLAGRALVAALNKTNRDGAGQERTEE